MTKGQELDTLKTVHAEYRAGGMWLIKKALYFLISAILLHQQTCSSSQVPLNNFLLQSSEFNDNKFAGGEERAVKLEANPYGFPFSADNTHSSKVQSFFEVLTADIRVNIRQSRLVQLNLSNIEKRLTETEEVINSDFINQQKILKLLGKGGVK